MSDEHEVVKQVQEYYFDFYAVNPQLFTFGLEHPITEAAQYVPFSFPPFRATSVATWSSRSLLVLQAS